VLNVSKETHEPLLDIFLFTVITYSLLKRFEDTKVDIESCKSKDGQYSGQKKKGKKQNKQRSTKHYTEN